MLCIPSSYGFFRWAPYYRVREAIHIYNINDSLVFTFFTTSSFSFWLSSNLRIPSRVALALAEHRTGRVTSPKH